MANTNIVAEVEGSKLILTIDLKKKVGPSKSGKTMLIATAGGGLAIEDMTLNLNLYKKLDVGGGQKRGR